MLKRWEYMNFELHVAYATKMFTLLVKRSQLKMMCLYRRTKLDQMNCVPGWQEQGLIFWYTASHLAWARTMRAQLWSPFALTLTPLSFPLFSRRSNTRSRSS